VRGLSVPRLPRFRRIIAALALASAVEGCATQADLRDQGRALQNAIDAQARSIELLRREVDQLSASLGSKSGSRGSSLPPLAAEMPPAVQPEPQVTRLEKRIRELEQAKAKSTEIGMTLSPEGMSTESGAAAGATTTTLPNPNAAAPQQVAAVPPPPPPPPPRSPIDEAWKREVAQERAVVSVMAIPQRAEYLGALDSLSTGDCSNAGPRLATLTSGPNSPLSDNALYWQARCAASRGDVHDAEAKLDEVVSRFPKGDKAPAALWERSKLLIRTSDQAGARTTLAKLIKDYPSTSEAAQARLKIVELEH
jgi:TolA-binding protein